MTFTLQGSSGVNLANFRDNCVITLTLNFSESPSTGWLSASSVATGSAITLTISASNGSYTHRVTWRRSAYEIYTETLSAGVTSSTFWIPYEWSAGSATASLETVSGGSVVGSAQSYSFSVTKSTTQPPSINAFTITRINAPSIPAGWNIYVRGHSFVQMTASATANNAAISTYRFIVGANSATLNTNAWTSNAIIDAGNVTCTVIVTDSNGNTATRSETIYVYDYAPPVFGSVRALRTTPDGVTSESGTYIKVSYSIEHSAVGDRNALSVVVQYRSVGSTYISSPVTVLPNTEVLIDAGLITDVRYEAIFSATDALITVTRSADITSGGYAIFFKRGGQNVGIGIVGMREMALEINEDWSIYHGNLDIGSKIRDALPATGGAMTGTLGSVTAAQVRNIMVASSVPSSLTAGTVCLVYE